MVIFRVVCILGATCGYFGRPTEVATRVSKLDLVSMFSVCPIQFMELDSLKIYLVGWPYDQPAAHQESG